MGWQDDPIAEESSAQGRSTWESDPVDEPDRAPTTPPPTMGQVALNAVPRAAADAVGDAYGMVARTPIGSILLHGLSAMGLGEHLKGLPDVKGMAEKAGAIDEKSNPSNGPQKVVDTAIRSAITSALVPGSGVASTLKNMAIGAISGAAGKSAEEIARPIVGDTAAHWIGVATGAILPAAPLAKTAFRAVKPAPESPLNTATRMQTFRDAQQIGFAVSPMSVKPSIGNQAIESIAGPGKMNIALSMHNQRAATQAAKQELGLPAHAELDAGTFDALKREAGKPYVEVEKLSGGKQLLEMVQQKRAEAMDNWRANAVAPSPDLRKAARQAEVEAGNIENAIDQLARQSGVKGLLDRVRGARRAFAKIYDVETATNVGDGHVSLPVLGSMLEANRPLSGALEIMGRFWNAAKPVAREGSSLGSVASGTDAASSALLGTIGGANSGSILGAMAGLAPGARGLARNRILSPEMQRSLLDLGIMNKRNETARQMMRSALIGSAVHNSGSEEKK